MTDIKFDRKTCTRCHGEGKYSYCRSHGTVCYGCNGTGKQLTARGKLQTETFRASMQRPASEIEVGHFIKIWPSTKWKQVLRVETGDNGYRGLWTTDRIHDRLNCDQNTKVESIKSEAHRRELLRAAIDGVAA